MAALEAGVASAKASLSAVSAGVLPSVPPLPGGRRPFRQIDSSPLLMALPPAGARPAAASVLQGADPDALRRWFGEPDLRRPEGDAEVLLFLGPGCALDVVLYAETGGARKRVAHAAARAEGAAAVTEAECLRGIGGGGEGGVGRAAVAGHSGGR